MQQRDVHKEDATIVTSGRPEAQDSQPEADGCGERDRGEEDPGASIVAGGDAAPVLWRAEDALDAVASIEAAFIVADARLAPARMQARAPWLSTHPETSRRHDRGRR